MGKPLKHCFSHSYCSWEKTQRERAHWAKPRETKLLAAPHSAVAWGSSTTEASQTQRPSSGYSSSTQCLSVTKHPSSQRKPGFQPEAHCLCKQLSCNKVFLSGLAGESGCKIYPVPTKGYSCKQEELRRHLRVVALASSDRLLTGLWRNYIQSCLLQPGETSLHNWSQLCLLGIKTNLTDTTLYWKSGMRPLLGRRENLFTPDQT